MTKLKCPRCGYIGEVIRTVPEPTNRTVTKRLRLTKAEATQMENAAKDSGETLSQYIRRRTLDYGKDR
jgi:hypothetical protein